jgi:signal transduction histidine kinase
MKADIAAGLGLTALGLVITSGPDTVGWLDTAVMPAATLPVIWRRRAPLACAAALTAGVMASAIPTFDQVRCGFAIPAALLVLYAVGSRSELRGALAGLGALLIAMVFLSFTDAVISPGQLSFIVPLCVGVFVAGRVVHARGRLAAELAARSDALERQRERTAALAVAVERTRLATQLDATARDRTRAMIALAALDEAAISADPEGARAAFRRIERLGRESLNEMRGLLGVLRGDAPSTRAPLPTLAQLGTLLETARSGGRVVDLDVEGERRPLPGGVELTAYRIVEHALDGADDGPVGVRLRYGEHALELEVSGATSTALAAARERVSAQGGTLAVQPPGDGRAVLRARLPVVAHA